MLLRLTTAVSRVPRRYLFSSLAAGKSRKYSSSNNNKNLLITLDAFGTVYEPRAAIHDQYARIAERHGIVGLDAEEIDGSFRRAFKHQKGRHPNYGRETGMRAEEWWTEIVINTFTPLVPSHRLPLPQALPGDLIRHFASKEGYALYPDVLPFLRELKRRDKFSKASRGVLERDTVVATHVSGDFEAEKWGYNSTIIGIVSNSDDRVGGILESMDITVRTPERGHPPEDHEVQQKPHEYLIDFITLSYDVGYTKPSHEIFDAAIAMAKSLNEIDALANATDNNATTIQQSAKEEWTWLHIGNDVQEDVIGACKAGGRGVLLDREEEESVKKRLVSDDGVGWTDEVDVVRDLREVLKLV